MRVLLLGSGGREHAIGWKLAQSPLVSEIVSLPGNPGLSELGPLIEGVDPLNVGAVAEIAEQHRIDLVVVGPEAPLAAGIADAVARKRIRVFGPTRGAARLESSKAFAKEIMNRASVPTALAESFESEEAALSHLDSYEGPFVVKADGLAAGKGVLVTDDVDAAKSWVRDCLGGKFGDAGSRIVIEEHLQGPELSVFAVCDGVNAIPLEPARDYKRRFDGDLGPNTGGMGSYSPVELPDGLVDQVLTEVITPTLRQMAADGNPFLGFLYAGLVLTPSGPKVIEFNVRLGDPETQAVLGRMESDFAELLIAATEGDVSGQTVDWSNDFAVNVVLAAEGYPESPRKGDPITGLDQEFEDVHIFHAGTRFDGKRTVTNGGRVLNVVGFGDDLDSARDTAYAACEAIQFKGKQLRTDIALPQ